MYSKWQFIRSLDDLTRIYTSGWRFDAHMSIPYGMILRSINHGHPVKLWRYDKFSSKRLESLDNNLVFLSSPEQYNDPADSMPAFDLDSIARRLEAAVTPEGVRHVSEKTNELGSVRDPILQHRMLEMTLSEFESDKERLQKHTREELPERIRAFRREIKCACFSEDPLNPTMWAHYSDTWKSFAVEYEIDAKAVKCCCDNKSCPGSMPFTLAPILYEKRFDISSLSATYMDSCKFFDYPTFDIYLTLIHATIHKDDRWSYEHEWRLFTGTCNQCEGSVYATLRPSEVILGSDATNENISATQEICTSHGIPLKQIIFDDQAKDYEYNNIDYPQAE